MTTEPEDAVTVTKINAEHRATRAEPCRKFVALSLGYWGEGCTIGDAIDQLRKAGGGRATDLVLVKDCHESTEVLDDGSMQYAPDVAGTRIVLRRRPTRRR